VGPTQKLWGNRNPSWETTVKWLVWRVLTILVPSMTKRVQKCSNWQYLLSYYLSKKDPLTVPFAVIIHGVTVCMQLVVNLQ
jgi:hypothetical protein